MKPIALISGCFDGPDGFHTGHRFILGEIRKLATNIHVVVTLNSDNYLNEKGDGRPLCRFERRCAALYESGLVDEVIGIEDSPLDVIMMLQPDFIVVGDDYDKDDVAGAYECRAWGGKVIVIERIPGHSTTNLIKETK